VPREGADAFDGLQGFVDFREAFAGRELAPSAKAQVAANPGELLKIDPSASEPSQLSLPAPALAFATGDEARQLRADITLGGV
jgi:hypothetical protein